MARALVMAAVLAAYAGTFGVPFIFDDIPAVLRNPSLHRLSDAWFPPPDLSVSGRPLANFSLSLNFAVSGEAVGSYHGLNLALHLAACGLIFGVLRRAAPRLGLRHGTVEFAGVVSALWALHPLATGTVTYVMQRTELLASCGALLGIYASVRAIEAESHARSATRWRVLAVAATGAAMLAKEIAVVVPVLVLLTDRLLEPDPDLPTMVHRRRGYYGALAATWLIMAALMIWTPGRGASAGLGSGVRIIDYAVSQLSALVTYLHLWVWPYPLIFDRGCSLIPLGPLAAVGATALLVLGITITATWRKNALVATALSWFFICLAPSSSLVPIATQVVGEHRAYLALLGPTILLVALILRLVGPRQLLGLGVSAALALTVLTVIRNHDYATLESIWADTARKAPENARAHFNHGLALELAGRPEAALVAYNTCLDRDPRYPAVHAHLARIHQRAGRHAAARTHFAAALEAAPDADLHNAAAVSSLMLEAPAEAVRHFTASLQIRANQPLVHYNLGLTLQRLRRYPEALRHLEDAARLDPVDQAANEAAARLRAFLQR